MSIFGIGDKLILSYIILTKNTIYTTKWASQIET